MEDLRIFHTDERRFLIVTDWNEYGKAAMQDEGGDVGICDVEAFSLSQVSFEAKDALRAALGPGGLNAVGKIISCGFKRCFWS